jgi:putative drug exporter of the RND superfamily
MTFECFRADRVTPGRLGRLGVWCYDHRRRVLAGWILGVLVLIAIATVTGGRFQDSFGGNGQSQQAQDFLTKRFPAESGDSAQVVFDSSAPLANPAVSSQVAKLLNAVRTLPSVTSVTPLEAAADGHIGFAIIAFDTAASNLPAADVTRVISTARSYSRPGFAVALGGAPVSTVVSPSPGSSEGIGITAAIIIMLLAFGSVVAMGLPVLTALVGVGAGFGLVDLISHGLTDAGFAPDIMSMIGLGVGIDYALFIVTRYRQELAEGRSPREAIMAAQSTAGRTVLFAGSTVVISLLGLFLIGQAYMDGLAAGTILAVLLVLAATLTLLPAMIGFAGRAIDRLHVPGLLRTTVPQPGRGFWWRWSRTVQRRPLICGAASLAVLVVMAIPLFAMRLAFTDAGDDPVGLTTRQAYDILAEGFGPGFNGPLVLAADLPGDAGPGRTASGRTASGSTADRAALGTL